MTTSKLSDQLGTLSADQLSTITYEAGVDQNGTIPAANTYVSWVTQQNPGQPADLTSTWQTALGTGGTLAVGFQVAKDGSQFTPAQKSNAIQALALWSDLANIKFIYDPNPATGDVDFYQANEIYGSTTIAPGTYWQATKTTPTTTTGLNETLGGIISIDLGGDYGDPGSYTQLAGYGINVLVHEVGHLLGLGHAGPYNQVGTVATDWAGLQNNAYDVRTWSIMSYVDPVETADKYYGSLNPAGTNWTLPTETLNKFGADVRAPYTPMGLDIFAAQRLYGAPTNGALSGGQTFGFNSNVMYTDIDGTQKKLSMYDFTQDTAPVVTLYDSGSNNALDLSGFSTASTVDLLPGTWTSAAGLVNNIFIEYGTAIDKAIGGTADDTFTLNTDGDTIDGGGGNNTATLASNRAAYSYGSAAGGFTLTDIATGAVNTFTSIAAVGFADGTVGVAALPDITWTGSIDNQFNHAGNWDLNQVPGSANNVIIGASAVVNVDNEATNAVDSLQIAAAGTLQIDSGQFFVGNTGTSSNNAGMIDINAVGTQVSLLLAGSMQNSGELLLVGPDADVQTQSSTVTIGGAGTIHMVRGNIGGRTFGDATPFDTLISSNLIDGSGVIGLDGFLNTLTFINQGTVSADDVLSLTLKSDVVNQGLLSGTGSLAPLVLDAAIDNSAGQIVAQDGGSVQLDTVTVSGGSIIALGSGSLDVTTKATLDGSTSAVTLAGALVVDAGAALTLTGSIIGGTIDASAGSVLLEGASLTGVQLVGSHIGFGAGSTIYAAGFGQPTVTFTSGLAIDTSSIELAQNPTDGGNGFINPATIALTGSNAALVIGKIVSFSGGGQITLADPSDLIAGGPDGGTIFPDELVNADNTISGVGRILGMELDNLGTGTLVASGGTLIVSPGTQTYMRAGILVPEEIRSDGFIGAAPGSDLVIIGTLSQTDRTLFGIPGPATLGNTGTITLGGNDGFRSAPGVLEAGTIPAGVDFEVAAPGGALQADVENDATVTVQGDAVLTIANTLSNVGTVALHGFFDGTLHHGATLAPRGDMTLHGTGAVTLRDPADTITSFTNADTLENASGTIMGAGQLGGGNLNLTNFATIDANVPGAALVVNPGTGTLISIGMMQASGGGTLVLAGSVIAGINDFPLAFGNGTIMAGDASVVQLQSGGITDGTLVSTGNGAFNVTGSFNLTGDPDISGNDVINQAPLAVLAGNTLTLADSLLNQAIITLGDDATLGIDGSVFVGGGFVGGSFVAGGGTIVMNGIADQIVGMTGSDQLDDNDNTILGGGLIGGGNLAFTNGSTVNATSSLIVNTGTQTLVNRNMMEATTGTLTIGGAIENDGEIESLGGAVVIDGALTGSGFLQVTGGTVTLGGSVSGAQGLGFDFSTPGELIIEQPVQMAARITGFFAGDTIDVAGVAADAFNYDGGGGTLSLLSAGTTVATLGLQSVFPVAGLGVAPDGSGGTFVTIACFAAGSRIRTTRGDVPVEALRIGDRVHVVDGSTEPVTWIGHRSIDCRWHPAPHKVWPVRIRAGAFGTGRPVRDLWLSPDHAILLGDALIPIKYLIDDDAIVQVSVTDVAYYHVELARHAALLAEGLPAESYLDTGDRGNFANGGLPVSLREDLASGIREANGFAPLVVTGASIEAARRLIAA